MGKNQPKQLKFVGEESFMCKRGTKERYLMMTAKTDVVKLQEAFDVAQLEPTTVTNPVEVPAEVVQGTMTPPVLISVPNWDAMDCKQILDEIKSIQDMLMVSRFSEGVLEQYNKIIQDGKATYTAKCEKFVPEPIPTPIKVPKDVKDLPTETTPIKVPSVGTTTITTAGVPIIQTGPITGGIKPPVGGLGGGGGAKTKEPKKEINWLWVLVAVTGAYLLLRRK